MLARFKLLEHAIGEWMNDLNDDPQRGIGTPKKKNRLSKIFDSRINFHNSSLKNNLSSY